MSTLHILSPTAASGKTVWTLGLIRMLRGLNLRVSVFKKINKAINSIMGG